MYHFKENLSEISELSSIIAKLQNFASDFASWSQKLRSSETDQNFKVFLSI